MSLRALLLTSTVLVTFTVWGVAASLSFRDTKSEIDQLFDAHLAESAQALLLQAGHKYREKMRHPDDNETEASRDDDDHDDDDDDQLKDTHNVGMIGIEHRGRLFEKQLFFQVWDHNGQLIARSQRSLSAAPIVRDRVGFSNVSSGEGDLRVISIWDSHHMLNVQVAELQKARVTIANTTVRNILTPIVGVILPFIVILGLLIDGALRPIRRLSEEVSRRSPDDLASIDEKPLPHEIRPTIRALNQLFARLARALENERRFTANAAHELRTPLAAIKVQAQVAKREQDRILRDRALDNVSKGVDRATHLVEQLLTLARLDPETAVPKGAVNLRTTTMEVLQQIAPEAVVKRIDLDFAPGDDVEIRGSSSMIGILIRNLVDNALRYTPQEGAVHVKLDKIGSTVQFVIEDTGPGLTSEQMEKLGHRFSRLNRPSGEGSGLGLSIVDRIAQLHGAKLQLENRGDGKGLRVTVTFPLA